MINKLKTEITTFLDKTGFNQFESEIDKLKRNTKGFGNVFKDMFNFKKAFGGIASNPIVSLAGSYLTLTGAVSQYNKMVEASNKQVAIELQTDTVLKAQGYMESQIQGLKEYASELQNAGVIGDEVSLSAIKQLASFKLQEDSIKSLLPKVHDLMVAEKGLNSTEADAEKWSKAVGIAISTGQIRGLKQAGIVLDEHTQKMFENANEQQRASLLTKELTERIGNQNAEILKTPEGKIINAQNRIGDVYETFGGVLRETRGKFWRFVADNLDTLTPFLKQIIEGLTGAFDTGINTIQFVFKTLSNMPTGAKNTIKLLTGFLMIKKFPIIAGLLVIEDVLGAFQGKDSLIEKVFNKMTEFFNSDYKFKDLRDGVWDFWDILTKGADSGIEKISSTTKVLLDLIDTLKGGAGLLQMIWGATGGLVIDTGRILLGDFENVGKSSFGNIKDGWKILHNAGLHMNETQEMADIYAEEKANEEIQRQIEEIKKIGELNNNNEYGVPKNSELPTNFGELESFKAQLKNDKANISNSKKVEFINKPTINITIEGKGVDREEVKKISQEVLKATQSFNDLWLKTQLGGDFVY